MAIVIDAWTFDVGLTANAMDDYVEAMALRIEQSWEANADIALFPEYSWAALLAHRDAPASLKELSDVLWNHTLPKLTARIGHAGKLAVLGTAPYFDEATGRLLNRAPVVIDGKLMAQDKLFLTPWETDFSGGDTLHLFTFKGLRIAVVICLDIEIPELSVLLRGQGVDLILVPSATETELGSERINRCASARAVELSCAVVVSPLVGKCASDLVDNNLGRLGFYLPSQAAFSITNRCSQTCIYTSGFHKLTSHVDGDLLTRTRARKLETNPALVSLEKIEPLRLTTH